MIGKRDALGHILPVDVEDRFWSKVVMVENCWEWLGNYYPNGYGQISIGKRKMMAHRMAYQLRVGPIPDGLTLDHLCRNPKCVNPSHLEPVTMRENTLRGTSPSAECAKKDSCKHGHPLSGDNLVVRKGRSGRPWRACRACLRTYPSVARRAERDRHASSPEAIVDRILGRKP
jgi:hypothetical protein